MLTLPVETIVSETGGELVTGSSSKVAAGVCIDSRTLTPGCAFVAIRGDRVDGNDFALDALRNGSRVLLVSHDRGQLTDLVHAASMREAVVIRVQDGVEALQALATYHRSRLHCGVLGVTGSTGKTTTKEFVDAVLSTTFNVISTQGNNNNEIGVPLTVLKADAGTDVLVIEMGMRGEGQIARLCEIARPTLGLVTNVGVSHIELLGTQDAVAQAKGELIRALPANGAAFLNGDDAFSERIAQGSAAPVVLYGLSEGCTVRAAEIELDSESRASFDLVVSGGCERIRVPVPGRHNVYNALAAAAVGIRLGVPLDRIAEGVASATLPAMRMQVFGTACGVTVVNDAYNANPVSMKAALETLASMQTPGRRVAVLGDMAELGSLSELAHFRIGEQVAALGLDLLLTVGERAVRIAAGAKAAGMSPQKVRTFEDAAEAADSLAALIRPDDTVLVKASRVMGLETVIDEIVSPR